VRILAIDRVQDDVSLHMRHRQPPELHGLQQLPPHAAVASEEARLDGQHGLVHQLQLQAGLDELCAALQQQAAHAKLTAQQLKAVGHVTSAQHSIQWSRVECSTVQHHVASELRTA
jgi:hypothetical protein